MRRYENQKRLHVEQKPVVGWGCLEWQKFCDWLEIAQVGRMLTVLKLKQTTADRDLIIEKK